MASPTSKRTSRRTQAPTAPSSPSSSAPDLIDPRWLLKGFAITLVAAVVCAYAAVCLLVYQGQWQYFVKPSAKVEKTPATLHLAFDPIRFDAAATGTPRLSAWWLPAASPASNPAPTRTLLFLHDGTGSLSDTLATLGLLHKANLNLFAIDYRGFGTSDPAHPTEEHLNEDAAAALDYLVNTRHLPASSIIPYGIGLGADLAARLAIQHPELPAIILDHPDPSLPLRYQTSRSTLLPMHALIGDHFQIASHLGQVHQPKLVFTPDNRNLAWIASAPDPKITVILPTVTLPTDASSAVVLNALNRFFDQYVPTPKQ